MKPLYRHRIVKRDGKWRWLLQAKNGRTVAEGRAVASRSRAERMVMRLFGAVLVLVLLASPAAAQAQDRLFTVSEWAVLGAHSLDAASTQRCLGAGRCREVNPWLARYESPVRFTAAKVGIASLQLWAVRKLKPAHPRLATVTNYAIAAGFTAIAIRNERIGR